MRSNGVPIMSETQKEKAAAMHEATAWDAVVAIVAAWRMKRAIRHVLRATDEFKRQGYLPEATAMLVCLQEIARRDYRRALRDKHEKWGA